MLRRTVAALVILTIAACSSTPHQPRKHKRVIQVQPAQPPAPTPAGNQRVRKLRHPPHEHPHGPHPHEATIDHHHPHPHPHMMGQGGHHHPY